MTDPQLDPDILDMLAELTRTHRHAEPYSVARGSTTWTLQHHTTVPALVHQLLVAEPSRSGDLSGATPGSRPAARIEALDTLMLIDDEAARWLRRLGEDDLADTIDHDTATNDPGTGTIACLQRLAGLRPTITRCHRAHGLRPCEETNWSWCCPAHQLDHDIRRWWRQARVISGWDSPAYRPWATCPVCDHRGGLRINLELQSAFCTECRETWSPATIGLLAEHIRGENDSDDDTPDQGGLASEAS